MPTLTTNETSVHYVKFLRGSISAWENLLATPGKVDDDTLYFIYASVENPTEGKLYLGKKLISGIGSFSGDINIADIGDVYIDNETLADKQLLIYNETSQKWENASLEEVINAPVSLMVGATENEAGSAGLVPAPQAGDQDKFLKGDGSWATVKLPSFDSNVFLVSNDKKVSLNGYNLAPVGTTIIKTDNGIEWTNISPSRLNYQITTLEKLQAQIAGTDPDPIDTSAVYLVQDPNSSSSSYIQYMVINNQLISLGKFGQANLSNYVTVPTFNTTISRLDNVLYDTTNPTTGETTFGLISRVSYIEQNYVTKSKIGDLSQLLLSAGNNTLVDEVNTLHMNVLDINERIKWQELENE